MDILEEANVAKHIFWHSSGDRIWRKIEEKGSTKPA
jgi:hypothetical protein